MKKGVIAFDHLVGLILLAIALTLLINIALFFYQTGFRASASDLACRVTLFFREATGASALGRNPLIKNEPGVFTKAICRTHIIDVTQASSSKAAKKGESAEEGMMRIALNEMRRCRLLFSSDDPNIGSLFGDKYCYVCSDLVVKKDAPTISQEQLIEFMFTHTTKQGTTYAYELSQEGYADMPHEIIPFFGSMSPGHEYAIVYIDNQEADTKTRALVTYAAAKIGTEAGAGIGTFVGGPGVGTVAGGLIGKGVAVVGALGTFIVADIADLGVTLDHNILMLVPLEATKEDRGVCSTYAL